MAHLRKIIRQSCGCGKKAQVELYNGYNALVSYYCTYCGNRALKEREKRQSKSEEK